MSEMLRVGFESFAHARDEGLAFAVVMARFRSRWIFCRHRERITWEIPGGHRERGETIEQTARRELYEETGAKEFTLSPVCVYFVEKQAHRSYGALFFAEVHKLGPLPEAEIGEIAFQSEMPKALTYPQIQPLLFERILAFLQGATFPRR